MTRREWEVLKAIVNLGGEATGLQIQQELVRNSKWEWLVYYSMSMYIALYRMERRGTIASRWATTDKGWCRPRVYSVAAKRLPFRSIKEH